MTHRHVLGPAGGQIPVESLDGPLTGALARLPGTVVDYTGADVAFAAPVYDSDGFWLPAQNAFEVPPGKGGFYLIQAGASFLASGALTGAEFKVIISATQFNWDPIFFNPQPWKTQNANKWLGGVSAVTHLADECEVSLSGFWEPFRPTITIDLHTDMTYFAIWRLGNLS